MVNSNSTDNSATGPIWDGSVAQPVLSDNVTVSNSAQSHPKLSWRGHHIQYITTEEDGLVAECILCEEQRGMPNGLSKFSIAQLDVFAAAMFKAECECEDEVIGYVSDVDDGTNTVSIVPSGEEIPEVDSTYKSYWI